MATKRKPAEKKRSGGPRPRATRLLTPDQLTKTEREQVERTFSGWAEILAIRNHLRAECTRAVEAEVPLAERITAANARADRLNIAVLLQANRGAEAVLKEYRAADHKMWIVGLLPRLEMMFKRVRQEDDDYLPKRPNLYDVEILNHVAMAASSAITLPVDVLAFAKCLELACSADVQGRLKVHGPRSAALLFLAKAFEVGETTVKAAVREIGPLPKRRARSSR